MKISVWSEGLSILPAKPDQTWVGKWISVVGLMEPPYRSAKYKYCHLAITITQPNQLKIVSESEAKYRLNNQPRQGGRTRRNDTVLDAIIGKPRVSRPTPPVGTTQQQTGRNQQVLQAIRESSRSPTLRAPPAPPASTAPKAGHKTWLRSFLDFFKF